MLLGVITLAALRDSWSWRKAALYSTAAYVGGSWAMFLGVWDARIVARAAWVVRWFLAILYGARLAHALLNLVLGLGLVTGSPRKGASLVGCVREFPLETAAALATPLLAFYSLYWTSHYDASSASSASSVPSSSTDTDAAAADDNSSSFFFFLSFSWWWSSLWMPLFRLLWRLLQHALYLGVGAMAWKCFVPVLGLAVTSDARKINFTDVTIHALALAGYFALEAAARVVAGVLSTASTTVLEPALASSMSLLALPKALWYAGPTFEQEGQQEQSSLWLASWGGTERVVGWLGVNIPCHRTDSTDGPRHGWTPLSWEGEPRIKRNFQLR